MKDYFHRCDVTLQDVAHFLNSYRVRLRVFADIIRDRAEIREGGVTLPRLFFLASDGQKLAMGNVR
jgi:hypothetical protein